MKSTPIPKPTLTTLPAHLIYALVHTFCQLHPLPKRRGRPPLYSEPLILTLALLRTRDRASYRSLLRARAPDALPQHALPALGTLVYRLQSISEARWHALLHWLAQQGWTREPCTAAPPYALVDGTGIGYAGTFTTQWRRGAEVRLVQTHLKAVAVGYWQGGRVWVMGLALGQAYADEGKLLQRWVAVYGRGGLPEGTLLVGDRLYGYRAGWLRVLEGEGWLPVACVEASWHQRVRASARLRARARAEAYPEVFGSVKRAYGSVWRARSWVGACCWAWGMFVLWNLAGLVGVLGNDFVMCWWWGLGVYAIFRTPSPPIEKSGGV